MPTEVQPADIRPSGTLPARAIDYDLAALKQAALPRLLSVQRACRELSCTRSTLYVLIRKGLLKSVRLGAGRRIVASSLEKLIEQGTPVITRRRAVKKEV